MGSDETTEWKPPTEAPLLGIRPIAETLNDQIATCTTMIGAMLETRDYLVQERAAKVAGIPMTPREMVNGLRKHAVQEVLAGRDVVFCHQGRIVSASYRGNDSWECFSRGTNCYSSDHNKEYLLQLISEATMFAMNVEGFRP